MFNRVPIVFNTVLIVLNCLVIVFNNVGMMAHACRVKTALTGGTATGHLPPRAWPRRALHQVSVTDAGLAPV